jgi:hypothetical protein
MTSNCFPLNNRALRVAVILGAIAFAGWVPGKYENIVVAQTKTSVDWANDVAAKSRLQGIVKEILAIWDKADVVCLGEGHARKNDSDLRIALIEHPNFARKVNVIVVEFADIQHQDILDRFILEGEDMSRERLREVWKDTSGKEVWESPLYEAFLRAVRKVNLALPRNQRVRVIAGDSSTEENRGKFIRDNMSREVLSKGLKGLAIYGSGHCICRGMGFPGELAGQYPGKIWAAFNFGNVTEGRSVFGLGDEPKLIPITGTEKAKLPGEKMFFSGKFPGPLGNLTNAIVYYGNAKEMIVPPDK